MKTLLSAKRQISIPKALCDKLDLTPGAEIDWEIRQGILIGHPIQKGAWKKLRGSISKTEARRGMVAFWQLRKEERDRD